MVLVGMKILPVQLHTRAVIQVLGTSMHKDWGRSNEQACIASTVGDP